MENQIVQPIQDQINTSSLTIQPVVQTPKQNQNLKVVLMVVVGLLVLVGTGLGGYYIGTKQYLGFGEKKNIVASPAPLIVATACTLEAKICPDGSSVGRVGPKCEFSSCPSVAAKDVSSWKVFSSTSFPGELKIPKESYSVGQVAQDGNYNIFISNNPIVVPETWDSPFTPVDIVVFDKFVGKDTFESVVAQAKTFYLPETLQTKELAAGSYKGVTLQGTFGDGYAGGEKVAQAFFQTKTGYIHANYYPFVDKGFSEDLFLQIMSTVNLK